MNDIEKRVKILEEKVHYLEETLDTLKICSYQSK